MRNGEYLVLDVDAEKDDPDRRRALERAEAKHPGGVFFNLRIGYSAAVHLGGNISTDREALIDLSVQRTDGVWEEVKTAIDTGFNDFLTLRPEQITEFDLVWRAAIRATLGDGSIVSLPVDAANVLWYDQPRSVDVLETQNDPLIGRSLLYGSRVLLDVVDGGSVDISPLP